jgi:hypothetical protein
MQSLTVGGTLGGCNGAVSSGTVVAQLKSAFSENCATLAEPTQARGTGKLKWNTGVTSKLTADFGLFESDMSARFAGTVTAGQFQGLKMTATVTLTPTDGNCTTTSVKHLSFVGTMTIK